MAAGADLGRLWWPMRDHFGGPTDMMRRRWREVVVALWLWRLFHAMGILIRGVPIRPSWLPCWRLTSKQGERLTIPMAGPTEADFSTLRGGITLADNTRARAKWLGRLDASWTIRPAYL